MSQSLKKEIEALVKETLNELGSVSHTRPGTGPTHAGFPQEPISSAGQQIYATYLLNSHEHLAKSIEEMSIVIDQLESRGHNPGDLLILRDNLSNQLSEFMEIIRKEYGNLIEAKKKRKRCRCPDGSKSENCCKKRWTQYMKKGPLAGKTTHKLGIASNGSGKPSSMVASMNSTGSGSSSGDGNA